MLCLLPCLSVHFSLVTFFLKNWLKEIAKRILHQYCWVVILPTGIQAIEEKFGKSQILTFSSSGSLNKILDPHDSTTATGEKGKRLHKLLPFTFTHIEGPGLNPDNFFTRKFLSEFNPCILLKLYISPRDWAFEVTHFTLHKTEPLWDTQHKAPFVSPNSF